MLGDLPFEDGEAPLADDELSLLSTLFIGGSAETRAVCPAVAGGDAAPPLVALAGTWDDVPGTWETAAAAVPPRDAASLCADGRVFGGMLGSISSLCAVVVLARAGDATDNDPPEMR